MTKPIDFEDLEKRVRQFETLQLPGQTPMMHMGTSYLVSDLWCAVKELRQELANALPAPHPDHPLDPTP